MRGFVDSKIRVGREGATAAGSGAGPLRVRSPFRPSLAVTSATGRVDRGPPPMRSLLACVLLIGSAAAAAAVEAPSDAAEPVAVVIGHAKGLRLPRRAPTVI